jgi:ABC-type transport system involved in cytochrome bd biosynthesis fused ATPase/permease subunit
LAYVPQKPWIMSGTVRDNITFTMPFDKQKFNEVIKHASMTTYLGLLVNRDLTEIGEKGANLSGGQKARIGLARALYSDRDIYLLDDIISAVDVHVGDFIMKETILKYLKKKTVIMPTHAVKFAEYADKIIIMKKGKVAMVGKYADIKDTKEFK